MAIVPTRSEIARQLKGLHLYHADMSNCSMRVRMTLEEKGLPWTSHHLSLQKKENVTPEYFAIHPNGLVPTLVHDGVVHIESNEIIEYLDERFPTPPLKPDSEAERVEMADWLKTATSEHVRSVKTFIYAKKMGTRLRKSAEEQAQYRALQTDPELLAFHEKSSSEAGLPAAEVSAAEANLRRFFTRAEQALSEHRWLVGDRFTLADIAWIPLHFTLDGAGFPFREFPRVSAWAEAIHARPSFKEGVLKWCPKF
jgi:GST-like protein